MPQITTKTTAIGARTAHFFANLPSRTTRASRISLATRSRRWSEPGLFWVTTSIYHGRTAAASAMFKGALTNCKRVCCPDASATENLSMSSSVKRTLKRPSRANQKSFSAWGISEPVEISGSATSVKQETMIIMAMKSENIPAVLLESGLSRKACTLKAQLSFSTGSSWQKMRESIERMASHAEGLTLATTMLGTRSISSSVILDTRLLCAG
mmetsp:Transcript_23492/g.61307  ORF Transcript_23492/g.61307 Transcript_23492/m.61307 type:complete len:212 (-) Transcript_23492:799-1434(-)